MKLKIEQDWKSLAKNLFISIKILFLSIITCDFFIAVCFQNSQKGMALIGIGIPIFPYVICFWLMSIIGLTLIFLRTVYGNEECEKNLSLISAGLMGIIFIIYSMMLISAIMGGVVSLPVIMNLCILLSWILSIFYYKRVIDKLIYKDT